MARIGRNINKKKQMRKQQMMSERQPIVEKCKEGKGCKDIDGNLCKCYVDPSALFRNGRSCPRAFHLRQDDDKPKTKRRVGQQKQKKKK